MGDIKKAIETARLSLVMGGGKDTVRLIPFTDCDILITAAEEKADTQKRLDLALEMMQGAVSANLAAQDKLAALQGFIEKDILNSEDGDFDFIVWRAKQALGEE